MDLRDAASIRTVIRIVSDGNFKGRTEREIVGDLMAAGVPAKKATKIAYNVTRAIQAGVQAAFTEDLPTPDGPPPDPLLAEAFNFGRDEFHRMARQARLRRIAIAFGVMLLAIIVLAWRLTTRK